MITVMSDLVNFLDNEGDGVLTESEALLVALQYDQDNPPGLLPHIGITEECRVRNLQRSRQVIVAHQLYRHQASPAVTLNT